SDPTAANPTVIANTNQTYTVTVTSENGCTATSTVDVVILTCGSIGDFVWEDDNADGIQDAGELGIAGVSVQLLDTDGNTLQTTTTNASGFYLFSDLSEDDYIVEFAAPASFYWSPQDSGSDDTVDSDVNSATSQTAVISLAAGEEYTDADAGLYQNFSELGDHVFLDEDGDGIQDVGEPGVAGVTVNLLDDNGSIVETTTTDGTGFYHFLDLTPGDYQVHFVLPATYSYTAHAVGGDNTLDSNADPATGYSEMLALDSGKSDLTIDAGLTQFNLALTKGIHSSTPGPYQQNSQVDFTITVVNEGGITATNTEVTDYVPTGLTITGFNANGTSVIDNTDGTYTIPSLAPGASVTFIIETTIDANFQGVSLTNSAEITLDSDDDINSTPANTTPSEDDQDEVTITINQTASIDIEKATNGEDADALPGHILAVDPDNPPTVTWTYVVTNTGTVDLTSVSITDDQEGPVGSIVLLPAGSSQTFTDTGIGQLGTYTNVAAVQANS
ncbi:MAG: SdrD B-like domain-containing protein, partial [Pseudomonadota bacterium]